MQARTRSWLSCGSCRGSKAAQFCLGTEKFFLSQRDQRESLERLWPFFGPYTTVCTVFSLVVGEQRVRGPKDPQRTCTKGLTPFQTCKGFFFRFHASLAEFVFSIGWCLGVAERVVWKCCRDFEPSIFRRGPKDYTHRWQGSYYGVPYSIGYTVYGRWYIVYSIWYMM